MTSPIHDKGLMQGDYDSIAEEYDRRYQGPYWDVYNELTLAGIFDALPSSPGRVLDAGAGTGKFSLHIAKAGHLVTLLDPSEKMLDVARLRFEEAGLTDRAKFVVGSIDDLQFPDDHFNAVISEGDPLSYCIDSHDKAAQEIVRVLSPGGRFYVSCDNRWPAALARFYSGHLDDAIACADSGASTDPYGWSVHAFTPDGLRSLFEDHHATHVAVEGKVIACTPLPPDRLARLIETHGLERIVAFERRLAVDSSLLGVAGHLTVTGSAPIKEGV